MLIRNKKVVKVITMFVLVQFVVQIFYPTVGYALTSGPSQPEFSSFEPVSTTTMVDEFTGDFTYNLPVLEVPGPHGSGYPLSLSYHSGVTPEEESSWVGYGWTLNAGAINRNVRGIPDDFKGKGMTYYNKMPKNWTATVGNGVSFGELFSKDIKLGFNASLRYNNYRGFGYNMGAGITLGKGAVSLGYNVSDGQGSFSLNVNPAPILNSYADAHGVAQKVTTYPQIIPFANAFVKSSAKLRAGSKSSFNLIGSNYGILSYNDNNKPTIVHPYEGASYNVSFGTTINPGPAPVGIAVNSFGSYTYQTNIDTELTSAFGYLYSGYSGDNSVMDYHVEKETEFNKRDVFLGLPFNDPDNFIVSGEGVGGGFRLYAKKVGQFGPKKMKSEMKIFNVGGDLSTGWTFGLGLDLGVGKNVMELGDWKRDLTLFSKPDDKEDEPFLFRFNNDMGGEWGSNQSESPINASISRAGRNPSFSPNAGTMNKDGERSGRSSFIGYNTNRQMLNGEFASEQAYNKNKYVNTLSSRKLADQDLVGEISVSNESGATHLYALPIYSKNEKNTSSSVEGAGSENIDANFLIYNTDRKDIAYVGEEQAPSYASTYLLTEITSPDYLDISNDGPTLDDRGGYTRFNYHKQTPTSDWYKWRMPYRGLMYSKNSHSDPKDDMGTSSEGEKEIYYLKSIETKTHVALFHFLSREDAKEAPENPLARNASPGPNAISLQKLDKIELYSLDDFKNESGVIVRIEDSASPDYGTPVLQANHKQPVKTVYFKYNNSLCQGLPNSSSGKLTLTSVFFEYNGISKTRLSPYQFSYEYPQYTTYPAKYTAGNDDVSNGYVQFNTSGASSPENPHYNPFLGDAWGNYQDETKSTSRFNRMETWVDQKPNASTFDPAAWNLKVIKLPSGGEIHIQYEQDDYNYVQDQEAHVMMNIQSVQGDLSTRIYLDASSVGLTNSTSDPNLVAVKDQITKRYIEEGNKIYFKMLYTLIGNATPDLATCNADFITGYSSVIGCGIDDGGLFVDLMPSQRMPRDVCVDFVKTQRLGMIDPQGTCVPGMNDSGNALSVVRQLLNMAKGVAIPSTLCKTINPQFSYLRVPASLPKKGGGLRVKRLMTFDKTLGEPVLYGNEYLYQIVENNRVISSGVAMNEPPTIREENILVDFIARKKQKFLSKIVAGIDKKQAEGALGESILPGASVGYSKVTVKNIHSGKTNSGFSISEFNTAKDYPVEISMTPFAKGKPQMQYLLGVFVNIIKDKTWVSQGFSFKLNAMHGQLKSSSTYNGTYPGPTAALTTSMMVSQKNYEYFNPGDKVPMMNSLFGGITQRSPGREVDLTFGQKKVVESSYDANIEGDIQVAPIVFWPIFYITVMPTLNFSEGAMYTHATTKVIRYPAILKKTTVIQDGIVHTEENIAFDEYTGKPVAVKSLDEFDGAYLSQSVPASWEYDNFKPKALSQRKVITGSNMTFNSSNGGAEGTLSLADAACTIMGQVTSGDLLLLNDNYYYNVKNIDYSHDRLDLQAKGSNLLTGSVGVTSAMILSSGRNNRLSENVGEVTFHKTKKGDEFITSISDSERWVKAGTNSSDGSLFIQDLNYAFEHPGNGTLAGPYYNMNVVQFGVQVPAGCNADLTKANIKNVQMIFKNENGSISVTIGTFDLECSPGVWEEIKMPIQ